MNEIAVIIPTLNRVNYLLEAVSSVRNQTFNEVTLHVVDNGSTDETVETLVREGIAHSRVLAGSAGAARMDGVRRTTEPFLLFLDDDDYLDSEALRILYVQITKDDADICYGPMREFGLSTAVGPLAPLVSSTLVRRSTLSRIGDFEPSNYSWIEWMTRARRYGIRATVVNQVVGGRRIHDLNTSRGQHGMKPYFEILRAKLDRDQDQ